MSYKDLPGINFSTLKQIERSPLHFRAALNLPRVETPAMRLGTAVHQATLTPETWRPVVVEHLTDGQRAALDEINSTGSAPAIYPGAVRRGKQWDAFEADHPDTVVVLAKDWTVIEPLIGKTNILTHKQVETASRIRDSLRANPHVMDLLRWARTEEAITWEHGGTPCKGRVDILNKTNTWDLKTAADISPDRFRWDARRRLYHVQLSWYAWGAQVPEAGIVAVESHEPYDVAIYPLSSTVLLAGKAIWERWLDTLRRCIDSDQWPGQVPEPTPLDVPVELDDEGLDWEEE